jgi:hypothetical protein
MKVSKKQLLQLPFVQILAKKSGGNSFLLVFKVKMAAAHDWIIFYKKQTIL